MVGRELPPLPVSDFVAIVNQTLEMAIGSVTVVGELANFRVSKNRWVYFDLKDEQSSIRCFGTVYMLPGPLEDGMMLEVRGTPRLHDQFGFSFNVQSIRPVGEGSLRKAAELLMAKLQAEGLFSDERKRSLPYPPQRIGLVTSAESAAYADFTKILAARWGGLNISLADVQVQGERAPAQLVNAIQWFNEQADAPEVLVVIRGGGSADDLAAFSTEQVVRAVAASRIPTLVAIGHEVDTSLAELAADVRASTPSNAAELLVPDRREISAQLRVTDERMTQLLADRLRDERRFLADVLTVAGDSLDRLLRRNRDRLEADVRLAQAYDPALALARGYAIVRKGGRALRGGLAPGDQVDITLMSGQASATVDSYADTYQEKRQERRSGVKEGS